MSGGTMVNLSGTTPTVMDPGAPLTPSPVAPFGGATLVDPTNGIYRWVITTTSGALLINGGSSAPSNIGGLQRVTVTLDTNNTSLLSVTYQGTAAQIQSFLDNNLTVAPQPNTEPQVTFGLDPNYTGDRNVTFSGDSTTTSITTTIIACFCAGTAIRTVTGDVAVETLAVGDLVMTASGTARPVRWIGRRTYDAPATSALPVIVRAGALADHVPTRDLHVSPLHALAIEHGGETVLIPAEKLVNGRSIVRSSALNRVDYIHVELDRHDVVFAEGTPTESFIDQNSRWTFHEAHGTPVVQTAECARRIDAGAVLVEVRERLAFRAALNPGALVGNVEHAGRDSVVGWVHDPANALSPVGIEVTVNDEVVARAVADGRRADVEAAGYADGRSGFSIAFEPPLATHERHLVRIRRASDGAELPGSPMLIDRIDAVDADLRATVAGLAGDETTAAFLATQAAGLHRHAA